MRRADFSYLEEYVDVDKIAYCYKYHRSLCSSLDFVLDPRVGALVDDHPYYLPVDTRVRRILSWDLFRRIDWVSQNYHYILYCIDQHQRETILDSVLLLF